MATAARRKPAVCTDRDMAAIRITLVTAPGCHFCEHARHTLDSLAANYPLSVEEVPMASEEGRAIVVKHRIPFPPVLLVDGDLFGHGRISRRRLEKALGEIAPRVGVL